MEKPKFITRLEENDPALLERVQALREFTERDGALPARIKTLMSMLCDAVLGHGDGVSSLAAKARAQGATEEEIAETVRIAFLFAGLPGLVNGTFAYPK